MQKNNNLFLSSFLSRNIKLSKISKTIIKFSKAANNTIGEWTSKMLGRKNELSKARGVFLVTLTIFGSNIGI